jgi:hypothetical protein
MSSNISNSIAALKEDLVGMLESFPRMPSKDNCHELGVCLTQQCAMQDKLFISLFKLYNSVSSVQDGGNILMQSVIGYVERSLPSKSCAFSQAEPREFSGSFALRHRADFSSPSIARNWRQDMISAFGETSQTTHATMMQKIEDVCFELERRCYDVEGPVRVAEAQRDRIAEENRQMKEQIGQQANRLGEFSESFAGLHDENARLEEQMQKESARAEQLSNSLASLKGELQGQQWQSEKAICLEKEQGRSKELEMMAALTEKDDQIEDLQEEKRHLQAQNERTRQMLDQVSKEKDASLDDSWCLKEELASMKDSLERSKHLVVRKEDEVKRLLVEEDNLRTEVESLKTRVCLMVPYASWRLLINTRLMNKTPKLKDLCTCCKSLKNSRAATLRRSNMIIDWKSLGPHPRYAYARIGWMNNKY